MANVRQLLRKSYVMQQRMLHVLQLRFKRGCRARIGLPVGQEMHSSCCSRRVQPAARMLSHSRQSAPHRQGKRLATSIAEFLSLGTEYIKEYIQSTGQAAV